MMWRKFLSFLFMERALTVNTRSSEVSYQGHGPSCCTQRSRRVSCSKPSWFKSHCKFKARPYLKPPPRLQNILISGKCETRVPCGTRSRNEDIGEVCFGMRKCVFVCSLSKAHILHQICKSHLCSRQKKELLFLITTANEISLFVSRSW